MPQHQAGYPQQRPATARLAAEQAWARQAAEPARLCNAGQRGDLAMIALLLTCGLPRADQPASRPAAPSR